MKRRGAKVASLMVSLTLAMILPVSVGLAQDAASVRWSELKGLRSGDFVPRPGQPPVRIDPTKRFVIETVGGTQVLREAVPGNWNEMRDDYFGQVQIFAYAGGAPKSARAIQVTLTPIVSGIVTSPLEVYTFEVSLDATTNKIKYKFPKSWVSMGGDVSFTVCDHDGSDPATPDCLGDGLPVLMFGALTGKAKFQEPGGGNWIEADIICLLPEDATAVCSFSP